MSDTIARRGNAAANALATGRSPLAHQQVGYDAAFAFDGGALQSSVVPSIAVTDERAGHRTAGIVFALGAGAALWALIGSGVWTVVSLLV